MEDNASGRESVSIIIPCRNEAGHIRGCLESIVRSEYPKSRLEVLVVDGMSEDGTRAIIEALAREHPFVRMLDNPRMIVPTGLNLAIKEAKGDVIVRMDAHSEFATDYVPRCVALLKATGAANAGGRVVNVKAGDGPWGEPVRFITSHRFGVGNAAFRVGDAPGFVDTVPFGTFRREVFSRVGLFDERLTRNQDNEFNARLAKHGCRVAYDPRIAIRYKNQADLRGLLRQAFRTAMWNVFTLWLHPYTFKYRRFVPAAFVAYLALLPAAWLGPGGWLWSLPLWGYLLLCSLVSAGSGGALPTRIRIAAAFPAYHAAYGAGTWAGLLSLATGEWKRRLGRPLS